MYHRCCTIYSDHNLVSFFLYLFLYLFLYFFFWFLLNCDYNLWANYLVMEAKIINSYSILIWINTFIFCKLNNTLYCYFWLISSVYYVHLPLHLQQMPHLVPLVRQVHMVVSQFFYIYILVWAVWFCFGFNFAWSVANGKGIMC